MKRGIILLILFFVCLNFVASANVFNPDPNSETTGSEDMQTVQKGMDVANQVVTPDGKINTNIPPDWKSNAEVRIEKINEYAGPISELIFGTKLSLSWFYVFAILVWLLLAELIVAPITDVFGVKSFIGVLIALLVASLSMHGFGQNIVLWLDAITLTWYASLFVIILAVVSGVFYGIFMKFAGKKIEEGKEKAAKDQETRNREILDIDAKISEEKLKSYKK